MDKKAAIEDAGRLLGNLGLDLTDPNYKDTPERMVNVLMEFTKSLRGEAEEELNQNAAKVFPAHNGHKPYKGMLVQYPITAFSLCSHHLLPIVYKISFAYIPKDGRQLGFSKITKIIRLIATRPMNQEDFTQEIVDIFQKKLNPKGLAVIIKGTHYCMKMRGIMSETTNVTSAVKGDFKLYERTRNEFLSLLKL